MLHQRNHQQFSDCHAEKSEARNPKKGPEALFLCKVEQVLWQNDQILWMPELSRTNNPDCSVTPSRRCYEMLLCRPALWLFMWRDIFLSRSAIGYERIRFWFDLTRADVIQLESVPCEAMQGLFWCPCFFLFLCVCVSGWSSCGKWRKTNGGVCQDPTINRHKCTDGSSWLYAFCICIFHYRALFNVNELDPHFIFLQRKKATFESSPQIWKSSTSSCQCCRERGNCIHA